MAACGNETNEAETAKLIEYDELQQYYLDIDENLTYEELIEILEASNLFYNDKRYTGGSREVKFAFEEGVAEFKRPDRGDYISVSFENDMTINNVEYINHDLSLNLFHYIDGDYWDLRNPEYAGYYIELYGEKAGNFTYKDEQGKEVETDYLKVDSKEEQFEYLFEYAETK